MWSLEIGEKVLMIALDSYPRGYWCDGQYISEQELRDIRRGENYYWPNKKFWLKAVQGHAQWKLID